MINRTSKSFTSSGTIITCITDTCLFWDTIITPSLGTLYVNQIARTVRAFAATERRSCQIPRWISVEFFYVRLCTVLELSTVVVRFNTTGLRQRYEPFISAISEHVVVLREITANEYSRRFHVFPYGMNTVGIFTVRIANLPKFIRDDWWYDRIRVVLETLAIPSQTHNLLRCVNNSSPSNSQIIINLKLVPSLETPSN
jgi:hypothetical protein